MKKVWENLLAQIIHEFRENPIMVHDGDINIPDFDEFILHEGIYIGGHITRHETPFIGEYTGRYKHLVWVDVNGYYLNGNILS